MWYSGLIVMKSFCKEVPNYQSLLQMIVRLVDAEDEADALIKLNELAVNEMENSYINANGHLLEWKVMEIIEADLIEGFYHGATLHSYFEWEHKALVTVKPGWKS